MTVFGRGTIGNALGGPKPQIGGRSGPDRASRAHAREAWQA